MSHIWAAWKGADLAHLLYDLSSPKALCGTQTPARNKLVHKAVGKIPRCEVCWKISEDLYSYDNRSL